MAKFKVVESDDEIEFFVKLSSVGMSLVKVADEDYPYHLIVDDYEHNAQTHRLTGDEVNLLRLLWGTTL